MRCLAILEAVILLLNAPEKKPRCQLAPAFVTKTRHFLKRIFLVLFLSTDSLLMHWSNYSDAKTIIRDYVS